MITRNYNDQSMIELNADDYLTLEHRLRKQVVACMDRGAYPEGEAEKRATDALNSEWRGDITVREWLACVGEWLGIDTSQCVGA
jgi:hypothetical protein